MIPTRRSFTGVSDVSSLGLISYSAIGIGLCGSSERSSMPGTSYNSYGVHSNGEFYINRRLVSNVETLFSLIKRLR